MITPASHPDLEEIHMDGKNECGAAVHCGHALDWHRGATGCADGCGCTWTPAPPTIDEEPDVLRPEPPFTAAAGGRAADQDVVEPTVGDERRDREDRYAQAIRNSNGTSEALAWWAQHPQLIPAHVYGAASATVADAEQRDLLAAEHNGEVIKHLDGEIARLRAELDRARTTRAAVLAAAIAAVEDPEQRRAASGRDTLGWESARDVLRCLLTAADTTSTETARPLRGDAFEQWLKAQRDEYHQERP